MYRGRRTFPFPFPGEDNDVSEWGWAVAKRCGMAVCMRTLGWGRGGPARKALGHHMKGQGGQRWVDTHGDTGGLRRSCLGAGVRPPPQRDAGARADPQAKETFRICRCLLRYSVAKCTKAPKTSAKSYCRVGHRWALAALHTTNRPAGSFVNNEFWIPPKQSAWDGFWN